MAELGAPNNSSTELQKQDLMQYSDFLEGPVYGKHPIRTDRMRPALTARRSGASFFTGAADVDVTYIRAGRVCLSGKLGQLPVAAHRSEQPE